MKRIALMLCGLSRTYRDTAASLLENVILANETDGATVDVFIHTWAEKDSSDVVWHNPDGKSRTAALNKADYLDLLARYQPKSIAVDPPLNIPKEPVLKERLKPFVRSYSSIASCFYSRWRVNQLREDYCARTGTVYDYVILTRLDVLFHTPFRLTDFFQTFEHYGCTPPKRHVFTAATPFKRGNVENDFMRCNTDIVLFAKPVVMSRLCSFYTDLARGALPPSFIMRELFGMEVLWTRWWQATKIGTTYLRYFEGSDYRILRPSAEPAPETPTRSEMRRSKLRRNLRSLCNVCRPVSNWLLEPFVVLAYALRAGIKSVRTLAREL